MALNLRTRQVKRDSKLVQATKKETSTEGYHHFGEATASHQEIFKCLKQSGCRKNLYEYIDVTRNVERDGLFTMTAVEMKDTMDNRLKSLATHEERKAYQVGVMAYVVLILHPHTYKVRFL